VAVAVRRERALVSVDEIEEARSLLQSMARTPPKRVNRVVAIAKVKDEIRQVLEMGYTMNDVAEALKGKFKGLVLADLRKVMLANEPSRSDRSKIVAAIKRDLLGLEIAGIRGWERLQAALVEREYEIRVRGRGLVVAHVRDAKKLAPLSDVFGKAQRQADLETRFGESFPTTSRRRNGSTPEKENEKISVDSHPSVSSRRERRPNPVVD